MKTHRIPAAGCCLALLFFSAVALNAQPPADLASGFDSDSGGWQASDPGAVLTWMSSGGSSGGYLKGEGPGNEWYYVSPVSWAGDWSGYRSMRFDLAIPSRHYADTDVAGIVVIVGTNLDTMTWSGPTPLFTWSHYEISLEPAAFGVDQATFDGILADVAEVRILAEYTTAAEDMGLDAVSVTTAPVVVHSDALVERFTSAVKIEDRVNGWKPVDDVTLQADPVEGRPLHGLYCDDWQDGRTFKVESPDEWAGDWSTFTELSFDIKWKSREGTAAGASLVQIFGANGDVLTFNTTLPYNEWARITVPLTPASFGPTVSQSRLDAVLGYVAKIWIRGEYDDGNDQLWLDNIVVSDGPLAPRVFETGLLARFGTDAEGWSAIDNASLGWDGALGFTGGAITCTDLGGGTARYCSPDDWSGDWSSFSTLRFLMRTVSSTSRAELSPVVAIYGFNGGSLTLTPPPPYQTWSPYTIDLAPETFGVDQATFDAVMADVAHLTLVGDIVMYSDVSALDDVSLVASNATQAPPPDRGSTFDFDAEGWRKGGPAWGFIDNATVHDLTEGNPPGCITVDDEYGTTYWLSPVSWAGDWRGYESLSFDLKIIIGDTGNLLGPGNILSIISVHGDMHQAIAIPPEVGPWNAYAFDLSPIDFGVSPQQFDAIMRDVVMVGIRSEWIFYGEREGLDNVLLSRAPDDSYWAWLEGYLTPAQIDDPVLSSKTVDFDHDGASNWDEFMALTDPASPLSCWRPAMASAGPDLDYSTRSGRAYQVWKSPDPTDPASWVKVGPVVTGDDSVHTYSDPEFFGRAFYLVEVFIP